MAGFDDEEKVKKVKIKSEKRKKKKDRKVDKLQVINTETDNATKLVIKIKRTVDVTESRSQPVTSTGRPTEAFDPFEYDPSAPDPLAIDPPSSSSSAMRRVRTDKVTPIRLKIARSSEGSGYVMKESSEVATTDTESLAGSSTSPLTLSVR